MPNKPKKFLLGAIIAIVLLAGGGFAFWYTQIRTEPAPVATLRKVPVQKPSGSGLDGLYQVVTGSDSFVGYRAEEVLAGISQTTTGRTPDVTGTLTISGTAIDDVTMTAKLTTLSSGTELRDNRARAALGTDQFPDATFVLTEPIELPRVPKAGGDITVTAIGDLTVKNITQRVEIPLQGSWDGRQIQIVTATPFPIKFSTFQVDIGGFRPFAEVDDAGALEIDLLLSKG